MNRERRKEAGKVFFDLSKYLLTAVAAGSFISDKPFDWDMILIAVVTSFCILVIAYFITPKDKL